MLWLIPVLPITLAALLYPGWKNAERSTLAVTAGLLGALVFGLVTVALLFDWTGTYQWSELLVLELGLSGLTPIFAISVPLVATPILVYAAGHEQRQGLARLLGLLLGFVGAMELLLLARDLLTLLIAWELVGAISWALISHHGSDSSRTRHASWAFLTTRFGDLGLYIAAAVAFSSTGSLAYSSLGQLQGAALHVFVAGTVLAAASKSAQLPFSPWLFAAMSGPTSASALLHSATMVTAGIYLIAQLHTELATANWFGSLAILLGLATAVAGSLVALFQPHAKRLLAASTSAHHGLMWVAVGAGYPAVAALHFIAHALAKAPLFLAAGMAGERARSYWLKDLRLGQSFPGLAMASLVPVLALAGVFPLGAAWTKEAIVTSAGHYAIWAVMATIMAGGLSAAYAARFHLAVYGWKWTGGEKPRWRATLEQGPVYLFAIASLATLPLWVPGSRDSLMSWLNIEIPAFKTWELIASLSLVVLGLLFGALLARKVWSIEEDTGKARAVNWLGLGYAAQRLLVSPMLDLSRGLAQGDKLWNRFIDSTAHHIHASSTTLAWSDDKVIDAGVRICSRFTIKCADLGRRVMEWLFDEFPEGIAHIMAIASRRIVQVQTGMVHHYYTLAAIGFAAMVLTLITGELL